MDMKAGHTDTIFIPGCCLTVQKNLSLLAKGKLRVMGATWTSWRTTTTIIFIILQIPALISVTTVVTGEEGQGLDIRCDYQDGWQDNTKYFCHVVDKVPTNPLIRTVDHNQWMREGRFSLYDNTTGAFFVVRVDKLMLEDSGSYWEQCDLSCKKQFTVSSLLFIPQTSSDYETMMPGVRNEPELCSSCSSPDYCDVSALPPPPPDLCSHFTSKQRESTVSLGHGEYVDVDAPGYICQYQHLNLSQLEEHVYHSLHGNSKPKDGLQGDKEQITIDTADG
ncbi:hypothetical protein L3Q82_019504 [Scortum barcoo]|uniref:Uncharacterized protein n=1 Tax=Scortum barcoo TaxID=214431 RepID=A0ACB8VBI2_9TELE|nr:hypothetical protein L3Q82_019504 [Scortum barcoo]